MIEPLPHTALRVLSGRRIGIWCITRKDKGDKIGDGVLAPRAD